MSAHALRWALVSALALLVMGTAACSTNEPRSDVQAENAARENHGRAVAIDAGAARALGVASRSDVIFDEGFGNVQYDPPDDYRNHAFRWMGQRGHIRLKSHGDRAMKLKVAGWLHEKVIRSKPVVTMFIDGSRIYDTGAVEENGLWGAELVVGAGALRGSRWVDLVMTVSAVAYHWSDAPALMVVVVSNVEWSELP
jgi:hypothetical protein